MDGEKAQGVFTDPSYNVPIQGHAGGLGSVKHPEFKMAFGEMSEAEYVEFLATFMRHAVANCIDGSIHFICGDWRHIKEILAEARKPYSELKNLCVWDKGNGGMGSLYRSQPELVFVLKQGHSAHINNVELGKHGRYRTNIWRYRGLNAFSRDREELLHLHPTVKPVALVADAIRDCCTSFPNFGYALLVAGQPGCEPPTRRPTPFAREDQMQVADGRIQANPPGSSPYLR